jgi:hypothetical protein
VLLLYLLLVCLPWLLCQLIVAAVALVMFTGAATSLVVFANADTSS